MAMVETLRSRTLCYPTLFAGSMLLFRQIRKRPERRREDRLLLLLVAAGGTGGRARGRIAVDAPEREPGADKYVHLDGLNFQTL